MIPLPHHYTTELSGGPSGYGRVRTGLCPELRLATPVQYDGPGDAWTPEHLLLAAVEGCYLFTLRAVANAAHIHFQYLEVSAEGIVDRENGATKFTEIVLRPRLTISPEIDRDRVMKLLRKAERACLVTASLATPIRVEAELVEPAFAG
jgi:peroxiredoxin-like protein